MTKHLSIEIDIEDDDDEQEVTNTIFENLNSIDGVEAMSGYDYPFETYDIGEETVRLTKLSQMKTDWTIVKNKLEDVEVDRDIMMKTHSVKNNIDDIERWMNK